MSLVKRYAPAYALPFAGTLCLVGCEALCDLLQPTLMSRVVDQGVAAGRMDIVLRDAALMLGFTLLGALFATARNFAASWVSQAAGARIRSDLFRRVLSRGVDEAAAQDPDGLVTRLTNDVTQVQNFFNGSMRFFFKAPILAVGAVAMAILLDPGLSPVLAVVVPLAVGGLAFAVSRGFSLFRRAQEGIDRLNGAFREFLAGIRVVKAFDTGADEEATFGRASDALADVSAQALGVMARVGPLVGLAVNLGIATVLWIGCRASPFRPGRLIAFVNYMTQILFTLMMAANIVNAFVRARASAERISEVMDAPLEADRRVGAGQAGAVSGSAAPSGGLSLSFEGVAFRWREAGPPVLDGLSFRAEPGQWIGILGTTGSGKSTLLSLACGFYRPAAGSVLVGGVRPYGVEGDGARLGVALVSQRVNLFTGTIRSNLLWGRPDASLEELEAAAEAACALDFIRALPEGWEAQVGRGGVSLSGGQKQRLSIARALVARPGLLLLDDSLSAVDALTETRIRDSLRSLPTRPTVLSVAQRVGSVAQVDRILVLEEGRAAGFGTWAELVAGCQAFREIVRSQTGVEADHV